MRGFLVAGWHNEKYIKKPPLTQAHPPAHSHTHWDTHTDRELMTKIIKMAQEKKMAKTNRNKKAAGEKIEKKV